MEGGRESRRGIREVGWKNCTREGVKLTGQWTGIWGWTWEERKGDRQGEEEAERPGEFNWGDGNLSGRWGMGKR